MKVQALIMAVWMSPMVMADTFVDDANGLAWDHPDPDAVENYRIYCDGSQVWEGPDQTLDLSALTLSPGLHQCHVTAAAASKESGPSNSLPFRFVVDPPAAPAALRFGG